jgi:uncharacterized protein YdhG (YjbR/CyaY superfamily)
METIDQYIQQFPDDIREKLTELRHVILNAAPETTEKISYKMPAFHWKENLIYFAAYKNHIGIYPTSKPIIHFKEELKNYKNSKGAFQIPLNQAVPVELIKKIVAFRIEQVKNKKGLN